MKNAPIGMWPNSTLGRIAEAWIWILSQRWMPGRLMDYTNVMKIATPIEPPRGLSSPQAVIGVVGILSGLARGLSAGRGVCGRHVLLIFAAGLARRVASPLFAMLGSVGCFTLLFVKGWPLGGFAARQKRSRLIHQSISLSGAGVFAFVGLAF